MCARLTKLFIIAAALLASPLYADDTEVYLGSSLTQEVRPNVLFIIDTSGSMTYNSMPTVSTYDSSKKYDGPCQADRIYWSVNGWSTTALPDCSTSRWFDPTKNRCKASWTRLSGKEGQWSANWGAWNGTRWVALGQVASNSVDIECNSDMNRTASLAHGNTTGNYAAASGGEWTTTYSKRASFTTGYTLYNGNYLNYRYTGGMSGTTTTRLEVVQSVLAQLLGTVDGINIAVMRFDADAEGGYFVIPMTELNDTNRTSLQTAVVKPMLNNGNTPLAETLYEAGLYFQGLPAKYGAGQNVAGVQSGNNYISPIQYQCQKNFIVLFSDGDPTSDGSADTLINAQPNFTTLSSKCNFGWNSDCLAAQTKYLFKKDLATNLMGPQNVTTYTIGFTGGMSAFGEAEMTRAAEGAGGKYKGVSDANQIADAFTAIVNNILSVNTTFTAPAVSVNAFNRLTYLDELYFSVFRPLSQPKWDGNIKRYRLGTPSGKNYLAILDVNGDEAIDPSTGFFKTTSMSFWPAKDSLGATVVDGETVAMGGAAAHIPAPADRNVYTCCFGGFYDLASSSNNFAINAAAAGLDPMVVKWARGVDVKDSDGDGQTDDARTQMGDPLHTEPMLVTYGKHFDGTADMVIYATDDEGFLHAFDTTDGKELFAFIPPELFGNLTKFYNNDIEVKHLFGLDGPMTAWVYDKNHNGTIEPGDGDHVYLYVTMRKGGKNIYALDVTDRDHPKQLWKIEGGKKYASADFTELGETWSRPVLTRVKWNGTYRNVLIFGGGYDEDNQEGDNFDINGKIVPDKVGRAIFMVDAETGANVGGGSATPVSDPVFWVASASSPYLQLAEMTHSIPSDVKLVEIDGDNAADRMYVGDMRGQLWRIDINKANKGADDFATGGILATLNYGDTDKATNRRFYYAPSVSLSRMGSYLNIAIGTGNRAHPTYTIDRDQFYVLRDYNVDGPAKDANGNVVYKPLTNFIDATTWTTAAKVDKIGLAKSNGFYVNLIEDGSWIGEKVLSIALTVNGTVVFTTYTPVAAAQQNACSPNAGMARQYMINVEDSTMLKGATERYINLAHGGIPPRPVTITVNGRTVVVTGTDVNTPPPMSEVVKKTIWRRK